MTVLPRIEAGLVHSLIRASARAFRERPAVRAGQAQWCYGELAEAVDDAVGVLLAQGLQRGERVAVYLEKNLDCVAALFGAAAAGGVFVPVNPVLKARQVRHILADCNARILVTSPARLAALADELPHCSDLHSVLLTGAAGDVCTVSAPLRIEAWARLQPRRSPPLPAHRVIDQDLAAILYTSGSTGQPKGVMLSHRNLVAGAESVAAYLENTPEDRLLAVLPLSFDYGLSQLTTAFRVGACAVLMNYLLPRDVIRAVQRERITGLAAVPPLWMQLARLDWPVGAADSLRYFTNSGGHLPKAVLDALRARMPEAQPFLMYGLTEAFRSTFLPPGEVGRRPDSIGKAIPNAEILVLDAEGRPCAPGETGELVHRGVHVALGYWNDVPRTAERFRPLPTGDKQSGGRTEIAVWSGDSVRCDAEGFLYFVGRRDEMIKTSGYRVSPAEVEEVLYASGRVAEAVAVGVAHAELGQAIVVLVHAHAGAAEGLEADLLALCQRELPGFMVPLHCLVRSEALPRNPNGKIDRKRLAEECAVLFEENPA